MCACVCVRVLINVCACVCVWRRAGKEPDALLKAVGPAFPTPTGVFWDGETGTRVAMCFPTRVDVFAVVAGGDAGKRKGPRGGASLAQLCSVPLNEPRTCLWHRNALFVVTRECVVGVFPPSPAAAADPHRKSFTSAVGIHGTVTIPLATLTPQAPHLSLSPSVFNLSSAVILGVRHASLLIAFTPHSNTVKPRPPADLKLCFLSLDSPLVKAAMCCVLPSQSKAALYWASTLPPLLHTPAAILLAVRHSSLCMCFLSLPLPLLRLALLMPVFS